MIPVQHPLALGTPTGYVNLSIEERQAAYEWRSVAQAYGAACSLCLYQYASYLSGVVSAAEQMEATIVLAAPRPSMLPVWGKFQEWRLRKALTNQGCSLETLALPDQGSDPVPYINLVTGSKASSSGK